MKKTARRLITSADKIMDAPYIQDDYCKELCVRAWCLAKNTLVTLFVWDVVQYQYILSHRIAFKCPW